jgi:hypothetical protein
LDTVILEQDIPCVELSEDASKGPHVDLVVVLASQDDLRSPIGSRLHIGAEVIMDEATGAEVNHLDLRLGVGFYQDVLWLQIAMDQVQVMDEV